MAKKRTQQRGRKKQVPAPPRFTISAERVFAYAVAAIVFIIPLFIWPGETEYGYGKTIIMYLLVSALLIGWAAWAVRRGVWKIRIPWLAYSAGFLILVGLLSLINAVNGLVVIQSLAVFLYFILFYLVVANMVRDSRDVTVILYALLIAAFFTALYGLLQYLGVMRGAFGNGGGLNELISTMGNRNYLGGFLAYLMFPSVILLVRLHSRILRAIALLLLAFNFGTAMLVNQTGIVVALIVALIGVVIGWLIFRPVEPVRRNRVWLITLLAILAVTFVFEAPAGPLNSVVGLSATPGSFIGRLWAQNAGKTRSWDWWIGYEMFKAHPILGVGLGNYKLNFLPYKAKFLATPRGKNYNFYIPRAAQAHNDYVQTAAELGILGIIGVVGLIGMIAYSLWIALYRSRNEADRFDLLLLTGGVITFLVHALVSFPAHLPASSLVLVTILGIATSRAYTDTAHTTVTIKRVPLAAMAAVVAAFCVFVSVVAVRDYAADFLFQAGVQELQLGQTNLAIETFNHSIQLDFCPRQTYFYLATAEIQAGNYKQALADLEKCRTRYVTEPVYLNIANLAVNLGDIKTAQKNINFILSTHPSSDMALQAEYLNGIIAIRAGDYTRASQILNELVKRHRDFERGYIALGDLYRAQGLTVSARKNYETSLKLITARLARDNSHLNSGKPITGQEYSRLRNEITMLTQEKQAVEASLAKLP